MRLFLNAIFDFKPKDKAFVTVPPVLREVLEENSWTPKRFLFDLYDVNEASSEGRTPHAMLMKRFPQICPYWHNTSGYYAAMNQKSVLNRTNAPVPEIRPHGYGFFSNFPGRKDGEAVFWPDDPAVDMELLEGICAAIPRPCTFYSAIAVWDGISWYPDSDLTPALRYVQRGMVSRILNRENGQGITNFMSAVWGIRATVCSYPMNSERGRNWRSEWRSPISTLWMRL